MDKQTVNLWIQGNIENITQILGVQPTSTRINQPYDFWDYSIESRGSDDSLASMLEFLEKNKLNIVKIGSQYNYGLSVTIETDGDSADVFHLLEPHEMAFLGEIEMHIAFHTVQL